MDTLTGMRSYVAVVATGSFTQAAERLGISRALTSKYVGQLEEHLGVRLLNRTTGKLSVTEGEQAYYQRCRQLLEDLDELEAAVRQQQAPPQGQLRVTALLIFGESYLTRTVADYMKEQPGVSVELVLTDRFVNIVDEGFDLAIRIGRLADSSLIARRLAPMRVVMCASPAYLEASGTPSVLDELATLDCVIDINIEEPEYWVFKRLGQTFRVKVSVRFRVNSARAVREMLLAGGGIGGCPRYVVAEELKAGSLQVLLPEYETTEYGIYAVYSHQRHLAAKVRTFVDFLVQRFGESSEW